MQQPAFPQYLTESAKRKVHSLQRPCSAFLRVNYGINQRLQGRHFSHRNGKMRIKGNLADDATHKKIKAIIRRRHPGWNITGWTGVAYLTCGQRLVDASAAERVTGAGAPSASVRPPHTASRYGLALAVPGSPRPFQAKL